MSKKNPVVPLAPEIENQVDIAQEAPAIKKPANLGRFIGFEAVGKERYKIAILDTVDGEVVARQDIDCGLNGISMHSAFFRFNSIINRNVRFFLPNLWRFNPDIVGVDSARAAIEEYEKAMKLKGKVMGS